MILDLLYVVIIHGSILSTDTSGGVRGGPNGSDSWRPFGLRCRPQFRQQERWGRSSGIRSRQRGYGEGLLRHRCRRQLRCPRCRRQCGSGSVRRRDGGIVPWPPPKIYSLTTRVEKVTATRERTIATQKITPSPMMKTTMAWRGGETRQWISKVRGKGGLCRRRRKARFYMRLWKSGVWRRDSVAARDSSVVRGDAVYSFLCPPGSGGRCIMLMAKSEVATNIE